MYVLCMYCACNVNLPCVLCVYCVCCVHGVHVHNCIMIEAKVASVW